MFKTIAFICLAFALFANAGCGDSTPHAPTNLIITSTSPITLTWDNVNAATKYNIYRGTASGDLSTKTLLAIANAPTTSYTDISAIVGTTYYYQVTAVNWDKESTASNEVHATP